jgi:hypothetical protein
VFVVTEDPPAIPADDLTAVLGPARLAYFTPVHDQPILADRKAMFILGACGLMVSVLLFFSHSLGALVRSGGRFGGAAALVALLALAALLLAAAVMAYYGYTRPVPPMPQSLAWFRHVAAAPPEEYARQMYALDHPAATRAMLHYNYSIASQAAYKFRLVNCSLRCLRIAIPLWMVLLLAMAVWG